jgi:hypothetical protein
MAKKRATKSKSPTDDGEFKPSGLRERLARANTNLQKESPEEFRARIDTTLDRMRAEANSPGRESKQSLVRYPNEEMRTRLARLAKANGRSINAEIIDRLQKSMIGDTIANLEESVADILERIEKLESLVRDQRAQLNSRDDSSNQN